MRRSEARLAGILAISAEAIISIDDRQRITMFNHGAETIFGYRADETIGQPLEILLPERFRQGHAAHVQQFARSTATARRMGERSEIRALHKDGQEFIAEASISKLVHNGIRTFTVVLRDVTDRVARENAMKASEERLGLALAIGHIGLFERDHAADVLYWSPIYRSILGVAADAPASLQRYLDMIPSDARDGVRLTIETARAPSGNGLVNVEHPIIRPDGELRWLAIHSQTYFDTAHSAGKPLRTVGAVLDITERKQIEGQLERRVAERTAELSAVFDAVPDGIVTTSVDRVIRAANVTALKLFGHTHAEMAGMPAHRLYASAGDDADITKAWGAWENDDVKNPVAVTCRRKNGTTFPAMASGSAVRDETGKIVSRVGLIRDITDELKRQKALTQAQRMEAYGQLTGGVAHDFNNLLTVITGNQELLEMRLKDPKDLALLRRAQEAADMGARLTSRLLTFARRRQLEPTLLDLNEQIIGMVELLRRSIGEQVKLTTNLVPYVWPVRADASEIENAVLNLAINARDAMPRGGALLIETANCALEAGELGGDGGLPEGDYVRLTVSDTGIGMTPEVLQRAFEPFFTTKPHGKGTGLGLSTIYGFVRQSGGTMTIYSELDRGTAINIYLPRVAAEGEPSKLEHMKIANPRAAGETILVVEDNSGVRDIATKRLEDLGYKVIAVDNGPAALDQLRVPGTMIHLVFSDVVMPGGLSGYDIARWISEHQPATRVLLTSGYPDEVARTQSGSVRTVKLLRKPYNRTELAQALREALDPRQPPLA